MAWFIGYAIGIGVVAVVVLLLVILITLARRIAEKAEAIVVTLEDARTNTDPLWDTQQVNANLDRIVEGATTARMALESRGGGR